MVENFSLFNEWKILNGILEVHPFRSWKLSSLLKKSPLPCGPIISAQVINETASWQLWNGAGESRSSLFLNYILYLDYSSEALCWLFWPKEHWVIRNGPNNLKHQLVLEFHMLGWKPQGSGRARNLPKSLTLCCRLFDT